MSIISKNFMLENKRTYSKLTFKMDCGSPKFRPTGESCLEEPE